MLVTQGAATLFLQGNDFTKHDVHLAMIFIGVIAIALAAQALGVAICVAFVWKLQKRVEGIASVVEQRTGPILDRTNELLRDLGPKVHTVSSNVEQISYTVRAKMDEIGQTVSELNQTVQEINGRTRSQVSRVDGIVTDALTATEEISQSVQHSIKVPVRQIAGVIAGLKAGVETLIARSPFGKS